jgi:hypothetical protein
MKRVVVLERWMAVGLRHRLIVLSDGSLRVQYSFPVRMIRQGMHPCGRRGDWCSCDRPDAHMLYMKR